jgi:putative transposase
MKILRPQRKLEPRAPRKLARNRLITGSNQLWETDIKYGYIPGEDRFFYVASIIDVFDRCILAVHVGLRCEAKDILRILKAALKSRGLVNPDGLVLRSDNGPQFKSKLMAKECPKLGVTQEFIPFKTPNMNAHIESFHSIFEAECMSQHNFETFGDGYWETMNFVRRYNTRRLHSGCQYLPPEEYYRVKRSKTAIVTAIAV